MKKPKKVLSIRIDEDLKNKIVERAKEERRNESNLVIKILTDYFDKIEQAKEILNQ